MTDFQDIRAKLKADAGRHPRSGLDGLIGTIVASVGAIAIGLAAAHYLFFPPLRTVRVVPLQPSAAIPTFSQTRNDIEAGRASSPAVAAPQTAATRIDPKTVAGKSADEIGKIADGVCFARAHARYPHWSKTPRLTTKSLNEFSPQDMNHFNELMHCLITEAPVRYCSSSQRRMIAEEISYYFLATGYLNKSLDQLRARTADLVPVFRSTLPVIPTVEPDPPVIVAIETRLRDGYLTKADRERISANAPQHLRERFTRIEPPQSPCPLPPWWAFWR
jgi:hypothetical protein